MLVTVLLILTPLLLTHPKANNEMKSKKHQEINQQWYFSEHGSNEWRTATVPGTVHTDLLDHGLIPDPFYGTNEKDLQWIGHKNWTYKTEFEVNDDILDEDHVALHFHGLDTYADVYLNGEVLFSANNMFRIWKKDVKSRLKPGKNDLEVRFRNIFDENQPKWDNAPFRLMAFPNNDQADTMLALYSRKAQFHYGWDWGPRLITYGIWKPIMLEAWSGFDLVDYHVIPKNVSKDHATILTNVEVRSDVEGLLTAEISLNGEIVLSKNLRLVSGEQQIELSFDMKNPRLWWTNGLGESYLYDYELTLTHPDGFKETRKMRLGVRSVEVRRGLDTAGQEFTVVLNGIPVFMKGANHIPEDNFQNRVSRDDYEHIIRSAAQANMNMLRVWGGGIYEDEMFYELADEYGILIWQDMMFACAMYPGDPDFLENVFHEVLDNVKRLRNYASLALYCGNNENEIAWWQWGWKQLYSEEIQAIYEKDLHNLFYVTIPAALKEADPTRYYLPSSPIAGFADRPSADGDIHYWGVWHGQEPFESYATNLARFVSEYGFQSYPERSTVERFASVEDRYLISETMLSHQRCMADNRKDKEYGNRLIQTYMDRLFRQPKDFNSYLYVSHLVQAEGMRIAVEAHRKAMPYTMGTLYWQINDCWPAASWSSIDHYGNWKAAHYTFRDVFQETIVIPEVKDDLLTIHLVTDNLTEQTDDLVIEKWNFTNGLVVTLDKKVTLSAQSSTKVFETSLSDLMPNDDPSETVFVLSYGTSKRFLYLVPPKELALVDPGLQLTLRESEGRTFIDVESKSLAKNVMLELETGALKISNNYFDILPGQKISVVSDMSIEELKGLRAISLVNSFE
jgi:beta-mannosidase